MRQPRNDRLELQHIALEPAVNATKEQPPKKDVCPNCGCGWLFMGRRSWECLDCRLKFSLDYFKKRHEHEVVHKEELENDVLGLAFTVGYLQGKVDGEA